ncbi:MAG TPA: isocitrate/isopropylmalate dehydrogenase family protein [Candidatus Acidoferrales bacterium]|nr:isocitrate/isopropylmalate dehydrogenase family protein [Candidatus Acidoferrales bacterium]
MAPASTKRIAVIPGDGIGPEVIAEAVKALRAALGAGAQRAEFTEFDWAAERFLREGVSLPAGSVEMLRRDFDAILFGAVGDPRIPSNQHALDILFGLRFGLDLYVNVRPCVLLDRRFTPLRDRSEADVNFVVLRENTEGLYVNIGGQFKRGTPDEVAVQEELNTRKGVERVLRFAFEFAQGRPRKRLCMSDKSNALTHGHDLWQRVWRDLRLEFPGVEARHLYIDTLAMEMVRDPSQFDAIVTNNLFGDIVSDLGAQLSGGLGLSPSANIHPGQVSLFEPVHGSAPTIAGKNRANPFGAILTAGMLCDYVGWPAEGEALRGCVRAALREGKCTADLGGSLGTREAGDWIANQVAAQSSRR